MTETNEEQQRIEELIENKDYETLFAERIEQSAQHHIDRYYEKAARRLGSAKENVMSVLGAYLSYKSTKRQEQILKKQHSLLDTIKDSTHEQEEIQQDQKRLQKVQNQLVSDSLRASSKFGYISIGVSIIAIAVAAFSFWTSREAIRSSNAWQAEQTPLLQKIVENTTPTTQPADK